MKYMGTTWAHMGTSIVASFLASLVECVEALTVVLAVGSVRGWRSALAGSATAIAVLLAIVDETGSVVVACIHAVLCRDADPVGARRIPFHLLLLSWRIL